MPIGKVKVTYAEGSLDLTVPTGDSVAALVVYQSAKLGDMEIEQVYKFTSLKDLKDLNVTASSSTSYVYDEVKNYFDSGNKGKTLFVVATNKTFKQLVQLDSGALNSDIFTSKTDNKNLLTTSKNTINFIGFSLQDKSATFGDKGAGFSKTLMDDLGNASETANLLAEQGNPMNFVISVPSWMANASTSGSISQGIVSELPDWRGASGEQKDYNRISLVLGSWQKLRPSIGSVIGRLSTNPVQRKISRVRDGKIKTGKTWYIVGGYTAESIEADWDAINDKGYILPIQYRGKDGYFWNDDATLTPDTNDRKFISLNRVVDKVTLLTHALYQEELGDELETDPTTGKMSASTAAYLKTIVEQELTDKLVNSQEAIAVRAQVDPDQDVSSGTVNIDLSIVPYGYYRSINVSLGLTKTV